MRLLIGSLIVTLATCLMPGEQYCFAQEAAARQQESPLTAKAQRSDTRIEVTAENEGVVLEVHCPFGIDRAILTRTGQKWPESIRLHLHLKGLESFRAAAGETAIEWAVSSTGEAGSRVTLWQGNRETALDRDSPYFTEPRIVSKAPQIPLEKGYFEITLPAKLLESNPQQLELQWIDFYRN